MNNQSTIAFVTDMWLQHLPSLVVWVAGLFIAFRRLRDYPKVATAVIVSCALNLVLYMILIPVCNTTLRSLDPFRGFMTMVFYSYACLAAVATALLLYAAFLGRGPGVAHEVR